MDHLPIIVKEPDEKGEGLVDSISDSSSIEVKACTGNKPVEKAKEQILAETIVFSFLQKNESPELDHYLIPTLGFSTEFVKVCLYDCEHDVLLETRDLKLSDSSGITPHITIIVWSVLNYKYLCTGLREEMKVYKSGFHDRVHQVLSQYESNTKRPCRGTAEKSEEAFRLDKRFSYTHTIDIGYEDIPVKKCNNTPAV